MRFAPVAGLGLVLAAGIARGESPPITHVQHYTTEPAGNYTASTAAETTAAARFDLGNGTSLYYLELWFGPSGSARDVTVTIWDDTAETLEPGTMLAQQTFSMTPSTFVQTQSLFASSLPRKIRVGITSPDAGPPGVGMDLDGISGPDRNFVRVGDGAWQTAAEAALPGDWVIAINHDGGAVDPNPLPPDAPADPVDADPGDDGEDNGVSDLDTEGSCCSTSPDAASGSLLGLLVLGLLVARRRR